MDYKTDTMNTLETTEKINKILTFLNTLKPINQDFNNVGNNEINSNEIDNNEITDFIINDNSKLLYKMAYKASIDNIIYFRTNCNLVTKVSIILQHTNFMFRTLEALSLDDQYNNNNLKIYNNTIEVSYIIPLLTNVLVLDISNCNLTDFDAYLICRFVPNLINLNISINQNITDIGGCELAKHPAIEVLNMIGTQIKNRTIILLGQNNNIRSIHIAKCTSNISNDMSYMDAISKLLQNKNITEFRYNTELSDEEFDYIYPHIIKSNISKLYMREYLGKTRIAKLIGLVEIGKLETLETCDRTYYNEYNKCNECYKGKEYNNGLNIDHSYNNMSPIYNILKSKILVGVKLVIFNDRILSKSNVDVFLKNNPNLLFIYPSPFTNDLRVRFKKRIKTLLNWRNISILISFLRSNNKHSFKWSIAKILDMIQLFMSKDINDIIKEFS